MPWWVQRAYLEGLDADENVPVNFTFGDGSAPGQVDPVTATVDELTALGISVIHRG